jgi:hypothetical protein
LLSQGLTLELILIPLIVTSLFFKNIFISYKYITKQGSLDYSDIELLIIKSMDSLMHDFTQPHVCKLHSHSLCH